MNATWIWLIAAVLCSTVNFANDKELKVVDRRDDPEQVLFMTKALEAMEAYRDKHGEYSREWRLLDMSFNTNRRNRPTQQNIELWQPSGCEYVYRIVVSDKDHFLIQALGWQDKPMYEIRNGMKEPQTLFDVNVKPTKLNTDVPEPKLFLAIAATAMKVHRNKEHHYPSRWKDLEIIYSAIPYQVYSRGVRPSEFDDLYWQPRGCDYSYRLELVGEDHFLIQAVGRTRKVEYEIRDGMSEAQFVQEAGLLVDDDIVD